MTLSLDTALRALLLPVKAGTGEEYAERAAAILEDLHVTEDHADWVNLEAALWEKSGTPSPQFKRFVRSLLYSQGAVPPSFALDVSAVSEAKGAEILRAFSTEYFDIHKWVMENEKCDHRQAQRILSHTHSTVMLATADKMTASKIYTMMLTDGVVLGRSWATLRYILDRCRLKHEVNASDVEALFNQDAEREPEVLGDLHFDDCVKYVSDICIRFGYAEDLHAQLRTLLVSDLHPPYLCMLHFQLTLAAFFNHRLTNAYEFLPRGAAVLWLADKYNSAGLSVRKSPFLNNAKSVDALDSAWASSKKKAERHAARALSDTLKELDRLSDPSRSAAGQYIRALLHRKIRIAYETNRERQQAVPVFDVDIAQRLLRGVGRGNTATQGVIEQRLADCIALHEAGRTARWRWRGLGDSVFTTNTSQKKFGDIERKHPDDARIVAIEAHGGRLTEKYVLDHISTLAQVLPLRIAELEDRAPINEWQLELQFIAHELGEGLPPHYDVGGLTVTLRYRRFRDFEAMDVDPEFIAILSANFQAPLNAIHVHPKTRQAVLELIG
ncbi:hypothetical protein FLX56_12370 [Synechococcus moorigangaii CMS01]|nr:hypothetical protein [Synechococcus moorigangaii CMS01]